MDEVINEKKTFKKNPPKMQCGCAICQLLNSSTAKIDGLAQDCSKSSTLAMELLQSCT